MPISLTLGEVDGNFIYCSYPKVCDASDLCWRPIDYYSNVCLHTLRETDILGLKNVAILSLLTNYL